jgi:hypothetical protein
MGNMRRIQLLTALFVFLLFVGFAAPSRAQNWSGIIDPSRAVDWSHAGIPGGIPNRTTICATLNPGASASQINSAIGSCPSGQVVFLSAGTYNLSSGIDFSNKSGVTLRGAGANQTFLVFTGAVGCFGQWSNICLRNGDNSWTGSPSHTANWTGGYAKGTTQVTLSSTSGLAAGDVLILDQLNDSDTDPGTIWICESANVCAQEGSASGSRSGRAQEQLVKVTAINGNNVTITPGLYMPNWRASQAPGAWWASTEITMSGVEDLSIDGTNGGADHNLTINNGYNCWVKGVRSLNANRDHVNLYQAAASVVRDNYFYGTKNAISQSYGVEGYMSSDNLVENNIFQHITTPIQVNASASGTVFGYNFNIDDYYAASANWMIYGNSLHAAGIDSVLFEGNEGNGLIGDNVHGTHTFVTAFRNQYFGWEPNKTAQTIPVELQIGSRYFNIIGNVLGKAGYHSQYEDVVPNGTNGDSSIYALGWFGNEGGGGPTDSVVPKTVMRWGNYDVVTNSIRWNASEVPSGLTLYANPVPASQNLPASFYLSSRPSWWGTMPWPAVGPDVTGGDLASLAGHAYSNPAQACYNTSSKTNNILNFNASTCYSLTVTAPNPPTNVKAVAQ